jgi:Lon protease-like protein
VSYKILVCPVCAEQMAEPDYEYGTDTHRHYGIGVEPIEVAAEIDHSAFLSTAGLARFRMQDEIREAAFIEAGRAWFRKLPLEERERAEVERRRYIDPLTLALEDQMKAAGRDSLLNLNRQAFGGFATIPTSEAA